MAGVSDELKWFFRQIAGPAAEELGQLFGDRVKFWRWKNALSIMEQAQSIIESKGITPQLIPYRTLIPLLEASTLEDDSNLKAKWAELVASYASGKEESRVFINLLSELDPLDAKILDLFYTSETGHSTTPASILDKPKSSYEPEEVATALEIDIASVIKSIGNLTRLGLTVNHSGMFERSILTINSGKLKSLYLTPLGFAFMQACSSNSS